MHSYSPLRYPGGKSCLTEFLSAAVSGSCIDTYIEPFAGGAGAAVGLLLKNKVKTVIINDCDLGIFSFWKALTAESEWFISKVQEVPLCIDEWHKQKEILAGSCEYSKELGFAAFYLNRTNRSGILSAGPIGGQAQSGRWKLDVRFKRDKLIAKLKEIAQLKDRIIIHSQDAAEFIISITANKELMSRAFIYFDPPYYKKGRQLYKNFYTYNDHKELHDLINSRVTCRWIATYDNVPQIRDIYSDKPQKVFNLTYNLSHKAKASELMIFSSPEIEALSDNFSIG